MAVHGVLPARRVFMLVLITCIEWCRGTHTVVISVEQAL